MTDCSLSLRISSLLLIVVLSSCSEISYLIPCADSLGFIYIEDSSKPFEWFFTFFRLEPAVDFLVLSFLYGLEKFHFYDDPLDFFRDDFAPVQVRLFTFVATNGEPS